MAMSAAVVDPVGRNANWSVKEREGEGKDSRIQKLPDDNTFKCSTEDKAIDIDRKSLWTRGEQSSGPAV